MTQTPPSAVASEPTEKMLQAGIRAYMDYLKEIYPASPIASPQMCRAVFNAMNDAQIATPSGQDADWAIKWLEDVSMWFSRRAGSSSEDIEIQSYRGNAENALRIADILRSGQ